MSADYGLPCRLCRGREEREAQPEDKEPLVGVSVGGCWMAAGDARQIEAAVGCSDRNSSVSDQRPQITTSRCSSLEKMDGWMDRLYNKEKEIRWKGKERYGFIFRSKAISAGQLGLNRV